MSYWIEEMPTWLKASGLLALFCGVILWSAKDHVRRGSARTVIGGVIVELCQVFFVGSVLCLAFTILYPSADALPNRLGIQYVSSGVLCTIVGLFCLRFAGAPVGPMNRAVWAAVAIFTIAGYLFYRGWTHML